jgi:hypothetical protein
LPGALSRPESAVLRRIELLVLALLWLAGALIIYPIVRNILMVAPLNS